MSNKRFSHIVGEYFERRDTHPVTLTFKNAQVDDSFLVELDNTVIETFENRNDIELIETRIIEGDYWSGVLIEFNQSEFDDIDGTNWDNMVEGNTLISTLMEIYDEFSEFDSEITGVSTGDSVYAVAALESLGSDFFKHTNNIN